jgi:aryl-alcohol dehydrogenase
MGVCGMIGAAPETEVSVEMLGLLPGRSLRGIIQGDSVSSTFIPKLLALNQQGRFPFEKLITFYDNGLEDLNRAVEESTGAASTVIKPVLKISEP